MKKKPQHIKEYDERILEIAKDIRAKRYFLLKEELNFKLFINHNKKHSYIEFYDSDGDYVMHYQLPSFNEWVQTTKYPK